MVMEIFDSVFGMQFYSSVFVLLLYCLNAHRGLCFSTGEMSELSTSHPQANPCPCMVNGQLYSFFLLFYLFLSFPQMSYNTPGGLCHSLQIFKELPPLFSLYFPSIVNWPVKCTRLCIVTCMNELCLLSYEDLAKCLFFPLDANIDLKMCILNEHML